MDELIDILDANGGITGKTALKSAAHKNGWFHQTVHIWFYTLNQQVLLQQRGRNKNIHPLLWDVSVAGHIGAGESITLGALREIKEEIGIQISPKDLQKIGVFKAIKEHGVNLKDYEFHHTFLAELKVPISSLQKQESEVEYLKLISIDEFENELKNLKANRYVTHNMPYYEAVIKQLRKSLKEKE